MIFWEKWIGKNREHKNFLTRLFYRTRSKEQQGLHDLTNSETVIPAARFTSCTLRVQTPRQKSVLRLRSQTAARQRNFSRFPESSSLKSPPGVGCSGVRLSAAPSRFCLFELLAQIIEQKFAFIPLPASLMRDLPTRFATNIQTWRVRIRGGVSGETHEQITPVGA